MIKFNIIIRVTQVCTSSVICTYALIHFSNSLTKAFSKIWSKNICRSINFSVVCMSCLPFFQVTFINGVVMTRWLRFLQIFLVCLTIKWWGSFFPDTDLYSVRSLNLDRMEQVSLALQMLLRSLRIRFLAWYLRHLRGSLGPVKKPLGVQNVDMPTEKRWRPRWSIPMEKRRIQISATFFLNSYLNWLEMCFV